MKRFGKYLILSLAAASLATLASAQPDEQDKKKDKEVQQIIITNKGDNKKEKMTIVIDGDNVTVNGKPVDEFKGEGVTVRKQKSTSGPMAWSFGNGQNNVFMLNEDGNRAMLGVVTEKNEDSKGVEVTDVTEESGAAKAGLKEGDIILKIDDKAISNPDDLSAEIKKHKPGDKVSITYLRDKKEQKASAELGKWKGLGTTRSFNGAFAPDMNFDFKMDQLEELSRMPRALTIPRNFNRTMPDQNFRYWFDDRPRLGLSVQDTDEGKGVKVIEVEEEGNAAKAGIKENDIIIEVNSTAVNSADEVAKIVRESKDKPVLAVKLKRDGKTQVIEVKTPRKLKTADL